MAASNQSNAQFTGAVAAAVAAVLNLEGRHDVNQGTQQAGPSVERPTLLQRIASFRQAGQSSSNSISNPGSSGAVASGVSLTRKRKYPPPSLYGRKAKQPAAPAKVTTYVRDIVCLPQHYASADRISIPRVKNHR